MYEIWGAKPCAVQKAMGLSGDQNKRQNWAIVSICCPKENMRERGRERTPWADTYRIIGERGGKE